MLELYLEKVYGLPFACTALNDIDIHAFDMQNAYIQAPSPEKYHVIYGPELSLENIGKVAIIV